MPDISFDETGRATFSTKFHGEVTLSKNKWDEICAEQERWYYRNNGEKIATTLINPDCVRYHKHIENQFLYYKSFNTLAISAEVIVDTGSRFPPYFTVIIDVSTARICTVYPVFEPKKGNEYKEPKDEKA